MNLMGIVQEHGEACGEAVEVASAMTRAWEGGGICCYTLSHPAHSHDSNNIHVTWVSVAAPGLGHCSATHPPPPCEQEKAQGGARMDSSPVPSTEDGAPVESMRSGGECDAPGATAEAPMVVDDGDIDSPDAPMPASLGTPLDAAGSSGESLEAGLTKAQIREALQREIDAETLSVDPDIALFPLRHRMHPHIFIFPCPDPVGGWRR